MRSDPVALRVQALAREYAMFPQGGLVLCAVSGGADSMCLLHLLHGMGEAWGITVAAAHYNHQLRGAEAKADGDFVAGWCARRGIPFYLGTGDVAAAAKARGRGIEEAGRALRYAFLEETAAHIGAACIATAHNADDNAETLLLNLARGTGLRGLTGIPPRRGSLVRPLLTTPRAEIEDYLARCDIAHRTDATNAELRYARNRIRHQVMPVLRELNPRAAEHIAETAALLRRDNAALDARAMAAVSAAYDTPDGVRIEAGRIASLPAALAPRAVRILLTRACGESKFSRNHLESVVALARTGAPSARVSLPYGLTARRVYEDLLLTAGEGRPPFCETAVVIGGTTDLPGTEWRLGVQKGVCGEKNVAERDTFWLKSDMIEGPLVVRPRRTGDEIALPARPRKSLKKLFMDSKVPRRVRERVPVLCDGRGVLAVAGFGPNAAYLARPGEAGYEIVWTIRERST